MSVSAKRRPRAASPRAIALEAVRRVTDEGAYSNLLLPQLLRDTDLSEADRHLATELTYGTVRRLISIDHALGRFLKRPIGRAPRHSRAALRIGAYQLLFTRIPAHAAVSETVDLVDERARGFVNAILRRLVRERPEPAEGTDDPAVSARTGLSAWAVSELRRLVGEEAEPAAAALAAQARVSLRANTCRGSVEDLERDLSKAGIDTERGTVHAWSLRLQGGDPGRLPGYAEGRFAIQDEASAWVVDVLDPQPGERVLDACAGPGGKAGDIACRAGTVVAGDRSFRRARLVRQAADRLGVDTRVLVQDAETPALKEGFHRILVDAPCSGLGAARRRPELLWRADRRELSRLARLQVSLAAGAAGLLRPGATLVYSVCTFPRAETDAVCDALLSKVPFLIPDPFPGPDGQEAPRARLWPHRDGTDAMFVARFRRTL
ncbi:MAG TPA: 16S rRNA (cytosine(967)-C(5))-methyltransferase RsmB [Actinomycetota bacterium]|nr:16S rRNA (cytosine(967)-C(5))-methyltransferase RsmB [Actinomycetota bacterium]